ncbi:MAG: helicase [Rhodospirillales bacterium]|nr:MAG: helicase [Rhodospirillales bacterium]
MSLLTDATWRIKYTPDNGDLVCLFYLPALEAAVRYDRTTGYFSASALALAARGIEGVVRNDGRMRLIVGCTLDEAEVTAIERGASLATTVERFMLRMPFDDVDRHAEAALELLAWMVARGILDVKVAVPCDRDRRPVAGTALFHEKAGIIEDKAGNRLAFTGSINETAQGWRHNWESFHVFTDWSGTGPHVEEEETTFARLWADRSSTAIVLDVPTAVRERLLAFLPAEDGLPQRLQQRPPAPPPLADDGERDPPQPVMTPPPADLRRLVWGFIQCAPAMPNGGERVGEATAAVTPWPHQIRAFHRMYDNWPPKLLIADEVGLGKTIEAGLLLRQAWLSGRARRILILAPKAVLKQWQIELREKFNLNWPVYDGRMLSWYPSPGLIGATTRPVSRADWHREPVVIASSQLMRRRDRVAELLEQAVPWDLVVLDEAHHARRRGAGSANDQGPNQLLRLMQRLKARTQGLVLLTATPMQVDPIEVWDLLALLGLPPEWTPERFRSFFDAASQPNPSPAAFEALSALFRATEQFYRAVEPEEAVGIIVDGGVFRAKKILKALRDTATTPRRRLETVERRAAVRLMRAKTPVAHLISRHTRELLRRYHRAGKLSMRIADRDVRDEFIDLTPSLERPVYDAVEAYIASTYNRADPERKTAVGFVMTIYRRRLASSFYALRQTLEDRLKRVTHADDEDAPDDETADDLMDADEAAEAKTLALVAEESASIADLLDSIRRLPMDSKAERLKQVLGDLLEDGYAQVIIFTQYTDTMDFLRHQLVGQFGTRMLCFSGRGGEVPEAGGTWTVVSRDSIKQRFRDGLANCLICTDAAAEGLNFQFCGALVNYDMPWNPMKVEQRIGRIDRLGQQHTRIRIVNLHYRDTVEADVYSSLRRRIDLFRTFVGKLQPILSSLPSRIAQAALSPGDRDLARRNLASRVEDEALAAEASGFDLDEIVASDLEEPRRCPPFYDLDDLGRLLTRPELLPPGLEVTPLHGSDRHFSLSAPGMLSPIRVTIDPVFYEEHPESVELWSPGSPVFQAPDSAASLDDVVRGRDALAALFHHLSR